MRPSLPFRFDASGRTASAAGDAWIRDLIEQVLFTAPGERVNRPDFGSGLLRATFEPADDLGLGAAQVAVQAALQYWLADLIEVRDVSVRVEDATLHVEIRYVVSRTARPQQATFSRGLP